MTHGGRGLVNLDCAAMYRAKGHRQTNKQTNDKNRKEKRKKVVENLQTMKPVLVFKKNSTYEAMKFETRNREKMSASSKHKGDLNMTKKNTHILDRIHV